MFLEIIAIIVAIFGILLFLLAIKRLWRRKFVTGSLQGLTGLLLLTMAFLAGSVALNLYTYQQFTYEQPIADFKLTELEAKLFRIYITFPDNNTRTYDLRGDQLQVDARILKWSGLATLAGMKTHYRLERLAGRYSNLQQERKEPRTVFEINSGTILTNWTPDIWSFISNNQDWFPWVDAIYGSASYIPMTNQASYSIKLSTTGLITRPINKEAINAIQNWK